MQVDRRCIQLALVGGKDKRTDEKECRKRAGGGDALVGLTTAVGITV